MKSQRSYRKLSLKNIRKVLSEWFHGKRAKEPVTEITYAELRAKILPGYFYSINGGESGETRKVVVYTGRGGVLTYLDACEKKGLSAPIAAMSIVCHTGNGDFNMLQVRLKPKE